MSNISIFYINLASRGDRNDFMRRQFADLGLDAERIEATTPGDLLSDDIARSCNQKSYRWMTPVELACSRSHLSALERIVVGGSPMGLIIEDDIVLSARLPTFLKTLDIAHLRSGILKIETDCRMLRVDPVPAAAIDGYRFETVRGWSHGSGGYIVSQDAARRIIQSGELLRRQVDVALFDPQEPLGRVLNLRHLNPALVIQLVRRENGSSKSLADSDIHLSRIQKLSIDRPFRLSRLHYEIRKIIHDKITVDMNHIYHQWLRGAKKARIEFAS